MTDRFSRPTHRRWFRRHPVLTLAAVDLVLLLVLAGALELAFRGQWLDFWSAELARYNPDLADAPDGQTLLLLGDSFTAGRGALADCLRPLLDPHVQVVNSGVSGTTARDAALMAPRRLARFAPRVTIYQVYAGNDLLETRHLADPDRTPALRRLYWSLLDRGWWSLGWANYKLGQARDRVLRARLGEAEIESRRRAIEALEATRPFDPAGYRTRDRELARTAPRAIADQVLVSGPMAGAWEVYVADVRRIADEVAAAGSRLVVVVVPHCVQASPLYRQRFTALGSDLGDGEVLARTPQVLVERLRHALPGVEILDPLPAMQAAEAAGARLYRTHDPHLTGDGQQLVAELLAGGPLADLAAAAPRPASSAGSATTSSVATVAQAAPRAP